MTNPLHSPELNAFGEVIEPLDLELPDEWEERRNKRDLAAQSRMLTEETKQRKIAQVAKMGFTLDQTVDILAVFMPNCTILTLKMGMSKGQDEAIRESKR